MNSISKINQINQKELENNVGDSASWHFDYKDTSYIYIGNLPTELAEKDVVIIFSQYGIPTHINLIKDKETGKSRGFCYLKYEDYRSCVLAIDNFNGIKVLNKNIKVDHVHYKLRDGQREDDFIIDYKDAEEEIQMLIEDSANNKESKLLEYKNDDNDEFRDPIEAYKKNEDDEFKDPMEEYLKEKSKGERERNRRKEKNGNGEEGRDRRRHRNHRHRHSSRSDRHSKKSDHRHDRHRSSHSRDKSPSRDESTLSHITSQDDKMSN